VVELKETSPFAGLLPLTLGTVTVEEMDLGPMTSLSAFGDAATLLRAAHGLDWPKSGETTRNGDVRCLWFGLRDVLLTGAVPDARLAGQAAVVDLSDGWAVAEVHGAGSIDVLARLVPLDLRDASFAPGRTARTQVGHMHASVTRLEADRFMVMVYRSMAGTLVHDLERAMAAVASRG
jgi:sarcosine oxidase subunit gamma